MESSLNIFRYYIYTKIPEINLFAFAYLFHRDLSPINGTYCIGTILVHIVLDIIYMYFFFALSFSFGRVWRFWRNVVNYQLTARASVTKVTFNSYSASHGN